MDQRDVALTGLSALSGALTAFGPVGGTLALLGLSLGGILTLYGGSADAPEPALTGGDVDRIVAQNLLKQDVRDAWALISPTHDWYREWTVRAKSGEQFTADDLAEFDRGYADATGPNSHLRGGLAKLYAGNPSLESTPGQYGVPYLIVGVGLLVQLLELGIARTVERGEDVSPGQWEILVGTLRFWEEGIRACDSLANFRVEAAARSRMEHDPSIKFRSPKLGAVLRELEILYRGGASADGELPALTAIGKIEGILRAVQAAGHG